jgi:BRCA1-associated protein
LICGYIGCGRYEEADALYHYERSGHSLSMNLETNSIWDYSSDRFVHRVEGKNNTHIVLQFRQGTNTQPTNDEETN